MKRLAWTIWGLCAIGFIATVALALFPGTSSLEAQSGSLAALALPVGFMAFPTVGAMIASRTKNNVIGWLLLGAGVMFEIGGALDAYAGLAPALPGRVYAAWIVHWSIQSAASFSLFTFLLLLFPTGRTLSTRWSRLAQVCVIATITFVVLVAFKPGQLAESPLDNPLAIGWVGSVWRVVELPLFLTIMLSVPAAALSLVLRFRRSRGVERQQMKWFASSAVIIGIVAAAAPVIFSVEALSPVWPFVFAVGSTSMPVSIGIAVLRYRLYEIDRIISRTVSYLILTAVLGGAFALLVLAPGLVLGGGGTDLPDTVIAAATLVVAALFHPVRRRVQQTVDHRFNRKRYDAAKTIDTFTARLREQVDLESLGVELQSLVHRTMQPRHLSLWVADKR